MYTLLHLGALTLTVLVLSWLLPGVRIKSIATAVLVAVVFSVLNFFLGWLIQAVLFVPAVLTLGILFLFIPFIVNLVLLWLTDKLLKGFEVETAGGLLLSSAVITLVNAVFYWAMHAQALTNSPGPTRWV
ncbi:MAG TPA: phage holin family protein [Polyangia bacterium]|jgi:putative membrane protein|nr:phage holin family protein [Polyangia bacterium]